MIQPPKRAVTRFFIPLIDVMILLFCIFLLMPYVKNPEDQGTSPGSGPLDSESLKNDLERVRLERDRLLKDRDRAVRQQQVCVLEIDGESGKLFHRGASRIEINDQLAAVGLIDRERRAAPGREVYFLIQYPRELSGYPLERQVAAYQRWFDGVPHGFDNPRGRRPGGAKS